MDQNDPNFQDPAAALRAALAATQEAPADSPPEPVAAPDHDDTAVAARRRAAILAVVGDPDDAPVRFDAHGFPHRDGEPVNWSDIR